MENSDYAGLFVCFVNSMSTFVHSLSYFSSIIPELILLTPV